MAKGSDSERIPNQVASQPRLLINAIVKNFTPVVLAVCVMLNVGKRPISAYGAYIRGPGFTTTQASVVAETDMLDTETFPAASLAFTVKTKSVLQFKPFTMKLVVVVPPARVVP